MRLITLLSIIITSIALSICAADIPQEEDHEINVNNRVLCVINDRVITVLDLKKQLDMIFYREFPSYAQSPMTRYKFYNENWKEIFNEMVDRELVLADAAERQLPINDGEIREELEEVFGPHVIDSINQLGISYEEAWKHVAEDLKVHRMMLYMVNIKTRDAVTPQDIKDTYDKLAAKNKDSSEWVYNIITIRHPKIAKASQAATLAHNMLTKKNIPLNDIASELNQIEGIDSKDLVVTVSDEYRHTANNISPQFQKALLPLKPGEYSSPIIQSSRASGKDVYRIFYLTAQETPPMPSFQEMQDEIRERLQQQLMTKETRQYIQKLRKNYKVDEMTRHISPNFQPFSIR